MSRSLQQQAERAAGEKPDGQPDTIRANATALDQLATAVSNEAARMGKTHLELEGPVIARANQRAADRKSALEARAQELTGLAARMKQIANDVEADLNNWNTRVQRELRLLGGTGA